MRIRAIILQGASRKLMLSAALVGSAASIAGLASFATFTSSTSASQTNASGTVTVALGAAGGVDNRLTIGATNLAAGDTIERQIKLSNSGSLDLASVTLTTSAAPTSLLDTDATNGLQMIVEKCPVAWLEAGPPYTYTCGAPTTIVATRAVIGSNLSLAGLSALTAGGDDYLRVKLTLPSVAPNSLQGLSSTIQYAFTATQRTATAK